MQQENLMCWRPEKDSEQLTLHLKSISSNTWLPYHSTPFKIPDYKISGGSKGWATYQALLKLGWKLIGEQHIS